LYFSLQLLPDMMEEQQLIRPDLRLASKSANLELNEKVYIFQNIF